MKRNDIVKHKNPDSWFYGRVVRKIDDDTVLWLSCGLHFYISKIDDLELHNDYKGYVEWTTDGTVRYFNRDKEGWLTDTVKFERPPRFIRMTTLRKLKQRASKYHGRNAWNTPLDYEFVEQR